jgi:hypothetical protein
VDSVKDAPHVRRPKTAASPKMVVKVKDLIATDAISTTRFIAKSVGITVGARIKIFKQLLKQFPKYNNRSFAKIIIGDGTWVQFYKPKRKIYNNKIWATKGSQRPCIAKRTISVERAMHVIFFCMTMLRHKKRLLYINI